MNYNFFKLYNDEDGKRVFNRLPDCVQSILRPIGLTMLKGKGRSHDLSFVLLGTHFCPKSKQWER